MGGVHDPSDPPRPLALLPTAGSFPGPELEQPDYSLEERVGARVLDNKRSRERQEQGKVQTFLRVAWREVSSAVIFKICLTLIICAESLFSVSDNVEGESRGGKRVSVGA